MTRNFSRMQVRRMLLTTGIGIVSTMLFVMADTIFAGHLLGETAIAGVNVLYPLAELVLFAASVPSCAIAILRAIAVGRRDRKTMDLCCSTGVWTAALLGVALRTRFGGGAEDYGIDFLTLQSRTYGYDCTDIAGFFRNEPSLARIRPPLKQMANGLWYLDVNHRFLKDDFAFGLEICSWFAAELGCEVPAVSGLLAWFHTRIQPHQDAVIAPGTPAAYGLALDDVITA